MGNKINVLIVDDSAAVQQTLQTVLSRDPAIEVIGFAADPIFAMERMKRQWPDVLVLDVEMPRMDGITFLRKLMAERPLPVVICSTLTERGAQTTMQALAAGAVGIVAKPRLGFKGFLLDQAMDLIQAVKAAGRANLRNLVPGRSPDARQGADTVLPPTHHAMLETTEKVVAIGTSTGGTQALETVLTALPKAMPGIVVVQHMPEGFTASFADRLDGLCALEVSEARNGDRCLPGHVLIAPGGRHMLLKRMGAQYYVEVRHGPLVNRHRPSVDVLFRSVASCAGRNAQGIIMTGMGDDGARGLLEMRRAGAQTIAQDEASCVVYGMPKEAVKLDAVDYVVPLEQIPAAMIAYGRQ